MKISIEIKDDKLFFDCEMSGSSTIHTQSELNREDYLVFAEVLQLLNNNYLSDNSKRVDKLLSEVKAREFINNNPEKAEEFLNETKESKK